MRIVGKIDLVLLGLLLLTACGGSETPEAPVANDTAEGEGDAPPPRWIVQATEMPRGLVSKTDGAAPGYVLFGQFSSALTYLVDIDGNVVHTWENGRAPGSEYLQDDGSIIRVARMDEPPNFRSGGVSGYLQKLSWDGEVLWEWQMGDEQRMLHHDIEVLPNGNILAIAWERKSAEEARAVGRRADVVPEQGVWPGMIAELEPTLPEGANVVWEWHMWDHLIQDVDESLPNYGDPAAHPHRIDINGDSTAPEIDEEELAQLKALGYVSDDTTTEDLSSDMLHINAVNYNAELNQIALSTPRYSEIWILDHSTTSAEAAGSTGGRWGRGGDLLYRWGNASTYGRHENTPRQLFQQHDVRWIPAGFPGAGNLTIFNNNVPGPDERTHSAVIEIAPPVDAGGAYVVPESGPFGPSELVWSYESPEPASFASGFISGAHRLPNGNTFICEGDDGRFFEVTPEGAIVWEYWSVYSGNVKNADGTDPHPVYEFDYAAFRAMRILPEHPGLAGRELAPLDPQPPPVEREKEAESE